MPMPPDAVAQLADANRRALDLMLGTQRLLFEQSSFVASELLDRAQTETHLFAEFVSKFAGSHSVKDWASMCRDCSQHQLDFIRRDSDRLFKHGERLMEAASRLVDSASPR
ncbi:hypothetical protein JQ596_11895 [Bradyrhizobium manausense]|nr:hypothetical protein [Bradyrhizobium manausense]UVO33230.1 hypothetical protein KUF59_14550 [Bradyrhizobium arachidis]